MSEQPTTPAAAATPPAANAAPPPKKPATAAAPAAPEAPKLIVSSSPHFHTSDTVSRIMLWVLAALAPACLAGIYYFGWAALRVLVITTLAAVAFEWLSAKAMKRECQLKDCSAIVTGVLLAMNLPAATPWWICVIGSFFAIVIAKMIFGGIGCNPFNPALAGRVALLLAFPAVMTTWTPARSGCCGKDATCNGNDATAITAQVRTVEAMPTPATTATPLKFSKEIRSTGKGEDLRTLIVPQNMAGCKALSDWDLFIGRGKAGSLGETCGLALLAGGLLLIFLNIIRWQVPLFYIATVGIITSIAWMINPDHYADPIFHYCTGGLLLGAFFMATDMVTTPLSRTGAIIFAIGCGVITAAIRLWGNYPEGVSFSILIMNAFTPIIDRYTAGKPFGMPKKKGLKFS